MNFFAAINLIVFSTMLFVIIGILLTGEDPSNIRDSDPTLKKIVLIAAGAIFITWNILVGIVYNIAWLFETLHEVIMWIKSFI